MKYMGSKRRIRKDILQVISNRSCMSRPWVEPFVGGANMIECVKNDIRIGSDIDPCIIRALKLIQSYPDKLPKSKNDFSEAEYSAIRLKNKETLSDIECYAGYALSYGGKWLGGWCRDSEGKRDYVAEAYRNAVKQHKEIQGVDFLCCSYRDLYLDTPCIVYCDPPYRGTTRYGSVFCYDDFYRWCMDLSSRGHDVYISEYSMPRGFECIWRKEITSSLTRDTGSKRGAESLFIVRG